MSRHETNIARKERIKFIERLMEKGDKRSFTQIDADIELRNWTERYHPTPLAQQKEKDKNESATDF